MHAAPSRDRRRTGLRRATLAVRWAVVFLLVWQGQVPCFHCHGTSVERSEMSEASGRWLAGHLRLHHASVQAAVDRVLGWHFHADLFDSQGDPDDPKLEHDRLPTGDVTNGFSELLADNARLAQFAAAPFSPAAADLTSALDAAGSADGGGRQFFETFATSLAFPLRFCVLRC